MSDKGSVNNITLPVYLALMKKINGKVSKINATGIESLSDDVLNELKCGDIITKQTGDQKHTYIVTYKQEQHGICLSYFDGSGYIETISYDYTDGHWVFNSKDVFNASDIPTGTKLYKHEIKFSAATIYVISLDDTPMTSYAGGPPSGELVFDKIVSYYDNTTAGFIAINKYTDERCIIARYGVIQQTISGGTYLILTQATIGTFVEDIVTPL